MIASWRRPGLSVIGPAFEFEDLQRLSGFTRRADVERWAKDNGIPLKLCRGGVWTTVDAVNQALGVVSPGATDTPYPAGVI
jgi:hypothetical protein